MKGLPLVLDHTLIRPIGRGAFGQVWLARNIIGTYRAVKIVEQGTLDNTHHFDREFKGIQGFEPVSRLHDGLLDVLQVGRASDDSYFYYVMELGDDLEARQEFSAEDYEPRTLAAEYWQRTRIPALETALIGAQLGEALSFLHGEGLIHRDIKPSNILFVRGQPKIGDPGLVAMMEASQSLLGTPGYIPPEGPGTPQADIFSLGKLLYVITTTREPGEFPVLPPEMTGFPDCDHLRRLNLVILRACAYNPRERYQSAQELSKALLEVHAGGSPEESRRRLKIAMRIGMVLALLLVLAGAGYYRTWLQARAERTRLAHSYWETGLRLHRANDQFGAFPFLAETLRIDPQNRARNELILSRISFTWRYSPRLLAQWHFTNSVHRIAFDPSGRQLAVPTAKGDLWLWNWRQGPPAWLGRHDRGGKPAELQAVAFSGDGRWLASAGTDQMVRMWDVSQHPVTNLSFPASKPVYALAFHPREPLLAIGCIGRVLLSDFEGRALRPVLAGEMAIRSVVFNPANLKLLAGDTEGKVYEMDPQKEQLVARNKLHWIYDLAFNRDGSQSAAATGNRAYLDPLTNDSRARLRHSTLVRSVCFDPSRPPGEDRILTSCLDNTVRIWSCQQDEEISPPIYTETEPTSAIYSSDGRFMALATVGGMVRIYSLPLEAGVAGNGASTVSGDGARYARMEDRTNAVVRDALSEDLVALISLNGPEVDSLALDRTGRRMLIRQNQTETLARFELWNLGAAPVLVAATNLARPVFFDLGPDGKTVAFRQKEALHLWRPEQNSLRRPWNLSEPGNVDLRFSSDSTRVALVWLNNVMVLSTSDPLGVVSWSFPHRVSTVDLDPTGAQIVIGESPPGFAVSTNYVWDVQTRQRISPPLILQDGCYLARFSPNGRWLILTDQLKQSLLFHAPQWTPLPRTMRHSGIITEVNFSQDGRFVATQSGNRGEDPPTARVWDLATGEPVTPALRTHNQGKPFFLVKDRELFCSTIDRHWHRWSLQTLSGPAADLADLALLLSCRELTSTGETKPMRAEELTRLWTRLQAAHPDWFTVTAR